MRYLNFKEYINKKVNSINLIVGIIWEWSDGSGLIDILEEFEHYKNEIEEEYPFHHIHVWRWREEGFDDRIGKLNGNLG